MEHRENEQYAHLVKNIPSIEAALQIKWIHEPLLIQAFVHKSFLNEYAHIVQASYERLEFLGDSVLNLAVTQHLFEHYPEASEGMLSQVKSQWVNQRSLSQTMSGLGIHHFLVTGKGEKIHKLHQQETVLSDLFEAIVGALFLDQGWEAAYAFIQRVHISCCDIKEIQQDNPKACLQEWCLKHKLGLPRYVVVQEEGPQHDPTFTIAVLVQERSIFEATGRTKRQAEAEAARGALSVLLQEGSV